MLHWLPYPASFARFRIVDWSSSFVSESSRDSLTTAPSASPHSAPGLGSTQSLYRKYRPATFEASDLVGQDSIVRTLRNAIKLDRVAHAYLFSGPRGTGKTTTARLLAKAVNCLDADPDQRPCNRCVACVAINNGSTTDIIEIDAASNRGIDDIRELRERVKFAPTMLRTKFYIVDEAHQITGAAANAFLKTLEEPPPHTKFILATTDPEQLLPTIVSRCQRFDFKRITPENVISRLRTVADAESIDIQDSALAVIADHAGGSLRDALGMLDQLASYRSSTDASATSIDAAAARTLLGTARSGNVVALVSALADADVHQGLEIITRSFDAGEDPRMLNRQLVGLLRSIMFRIASGKAGTDPDIERLADRFRLDDIAELASRFSEIDYRMRHAPLPQLPLEVTFVQAALDLSSRGTSTDAAFRQPTTDRTERKPSNIASSPDTTEHRSSRPDASKRSPRPTSAVPAEGASPTAPDQPNDRHDDAAEAPESSEQPTSPGHGSDRSSTGEISVDLLHDLWPKIRLDVKARDRRIEAILSSCDPASVDGDNVTLVTSYKFHWEKMNEDAARHLVEQVISRLVDRPVKVSTVMRGANGAHATPERGRTRVSGLSADDAGPEPTAPVRSEDEQRVIEAAKQLFDAEEIETGR